MKLNQLTNKEIEALKRKCKGCSGTGEQLGIASKTPDGIVCAMQTCEECLGNKTATIEIEKEGCLFPNSIDCDCRTYKVGDELVFCGCLVLISNNIYNCDCEEKDFIKLKIIPGTENTWIMVMVK